jgi:hypothetical protein
MAKLNKKDGDKPAHKKPKVQEQLHHFFAHRAEWLNQELYDLFYSPDYLPVLKSNQSCVLIGGRGTGKTTVLRGLSYEGQTKLGKKKLENIDFLGVYYKISSNTFSILTGLGLSDGAWQRPFAHYFNLVICSLILKMVAWYLRQPNHKELVLDSDKWRHFQESLNISISSDTLTIDYLLSQVESSITAFELYVNNILDVEPDDKVKLTAQEKPFNNLLAAVHTLAPFAGKPLFILLDEYENFADYQQRIVNTLIKHSAGENYCFKVGVRELGWRVKHTLTGQELQAPNDFRRISISDQFSGTKFNKFAEGVCNRRLKKLNIGIPNGLTIKELLPGLTHAEEAKRLGVDALVNDILNSPKLQVSSEERDALKKLPPFLVWFVHEWETRKNNPAGRSLANMLSNQSMWKERLENYSYASLFALKQGKSGRRKFYSGWDTYVLMSGGNIRYLLQLVEEAIKAQVNTDSNFVNGISHENQTQSAIEVGRSNLSELEVVDVKGSRIMRLVSGLGRIFQIFADDPFGRAPEVNQFSVPELNGDLHQAGELTKQAQELLENSFSLLGLLRTPANKLSKEDSRGFDYFVHPIFSAYFRFSHRRKRKMVLYSTDIVGLVNNQKAASNEIITRTRKKNNEEEHSSIEKPMEIPRQLPLFL